MTLRKANLTSIFGTIFSNYQLKMRSRFRVTRENEIANQEYILGYTSTELDYRLSKMRFTEIVKKLKQVIFLIKVWFWAAVHSSHFHECNLLLCPPPVSVAVHLSITSYEFLLIQIAFNRPKLSLYIPWYVCASFRRDGREQYEIVSEPSIDDIPF